MLRFLLDILFQLKDLPGFRFLGKYYYGINSKYLSVMDKADDMGERAGGFVKGVKTVKDVPKTYKGSKKQR